ncbi:MAG TPA: ribbon-helix-helix protein, CopG family [Thermoanaerobaculia bacterium]|nr:ribbon-helix-helix protein, CopG family [Thermoanaerobaculia bacterium]
MPTSVRLDPETEHALEQLARSRSVSKSEIVRQAIELLVSQEREAPPFDRVADLIGSVRGGPPDLSEETGKRFRQLLASRKG